jgi:prepilin-type N-terminal cleavage/methylation domain-containing protein
MFRAVSDFSISPRIRARSRGFTLTELMVVVTLVGILATIGVASFKKQAMASKSNEAASVIQAIRGAQESFRAENQIYLNVSASGAWYPSDKYGETAYNFQTDTHADIAAWRLLNVRVTRLVQFRYRVNAGAAGTALPALNIAGSPGWPNPPTEPWYVIQARADFNDDKVYCNALASSFNSEIYIENDGE